MAYLRSIERECLTCRKRATVELVNRFNESMGHYCKPCGQRAEKRLQASEADALRRKP